MPRFGRPPLLTEDLKTLKLVEGLAYIQCTRADAAAVLGVYKDTFDDYLHRHKSALARWELGQAAGRQSLRRWQFRAAENGSAAMMIWLGKQYLGQREVQEVRGPDGGPVVVQIVRFAE